MVNNNRYGFIESALGPGFHYLLNPNPTPASRQKVNSSKKFYLFEKITINVPLFKKLRDKMSRDMAQKVIVPKKKIMPQSFLNSGTLVILRLFATMGPQFYSFLTMEKYNVLLPSQLCCAFR
jgi:hypothetical protein